MCPNCVTPWKCNGPHIPEAVSDRPIHEVLAEISAKVPPEEWAKLDKTHYADPDTLATLNRLERENADLRAKLESERDKYLKLSEAYEGCDVELKEANRDVIVLCLRLCMEPNNSHSPDTADVLHRWRKAWEAAAGGMPIDAAIAKEGK